MQVRYPVFNKNTRIVPKFIDINDPDQVHSVGLNAQGSIYFISHGYLESGDRPWVQDMVNALLDQDLHGTASVVVIDWGHKGASSPPYVQGKRHSLINKYKHLLNCLSPLPPQLWPTLA